MRILLLVGMLCLYTSTCFANMFGTRSINYWPIPKEYLQAYEEHDKNADPKYLNDPDCFHAPYGIEVRKTWEPTDLRSYTEKRKFGADLMIAAEGGYMQEYKNGCITKSNTGSMRDIFYIENEDITKRKFGYAVIVDRPNKYNKSKGTHIEWDIKWYTYTDVPKSQLTERELRDRSYAEALYMHYKKKEFFGKDWLACENTEEGLKIFTSNNDKEMF